MHGSLGCLRTLSIPVPKKDLSSDPSRNPPNLFHNNLGSFVKQQPKTSTQQDTYPELDKGEHKVRDQQDKEQGRH